MRKIGLWVLLLLTIGATAQTGNIKGKIKTADGKAAVDVSVLVPSINKGTVTLEDGTFVLRNIKPGSYQLVITHEGLQTISKSITVKADAVQELQFTIRETAQELNEVIVQGRRTVNDKAITIGKSPIKPMDLPQAIAVVANETIQNQQAQRLSDVLKNVNGVYLATTRGATQENFSARGYSLSSSNLFKDGSRINSGSIPEMSSLERVEVLKGSAAILFGNVAPGGIVNLVTKQPKFYNGGEISLRTGSYGLLKPAVDVYGPLSKNVAYRINGTYETADSYRDAVHSKRYYINPSLLVKLGKRTELLVQGDYLSHDFTPDFGLGTYDNTRIPDVPRSTFYGTPWQYAKTRQSDFNGTIRHTINDQWNVNASVSYQHYSRDYYSTERIQAQINGDWARSLNRTNTIEDYYTAQLNLNGKFTTGSVEHTVLAGIDADRYFNTAYTFNQPVIYDTINILDPAKFTARTNIPDAREIRVVKTPTVRVGAYVQDLISVSEKWKVLLGLRWSIQDAKAAKTTNLLTNTTTAGTIKTDKAFSPRAGIIYRAARNTSLFASYANSFSVNSGTDVYGNALAPSIIDQFEAGVKNDFLQGMLSANVTVYKIINNNLAQTALFLADGVTPNNNTSLKSLNGQTMSDGLEIDLSAHPSAELDIRAGYSYNYIRYTKTPDAKGNFIEGERLQNSVGSTANGSIFYNSNGLKLGASVFYTGPRTSGFNNTKGQTQNFNRLFPVSDFTTVDISAGYTFRKISVLAKVFNLTNTLNYYVHENYSINPIPPTQLIATVTYRF